MNLTKASKNKPIPPKDLRNYGFIMAGAFSSVFGCLFPYLKKTPTPSWPWILALCFFIPAILKPQMLAPVYKAWMKLGGILGFINTTIILTAVYFIIFTPVSLLFRIIGKDSMKRKYEPNSLSYREVKTEQNSGIKMEAPY
jgi:hypothetical protein